MHRDLPELARARSGGVPASVYLVLLFWVGQFCALTAQRALMGAGDDSSFLVPRAIVGTVGVAISLGIGVLLKRQAGHGWAVRLSTALLFALAGAVLHSAVNFVVFQAFMPRENWSQATLPSYFSAVMQWFWAYCAISAMLLSGAYGAELREGEQHMAELRHLAHTAQLRALQYQLNPHFMFNTLNSIAALISSGKSDRAEQMVENLSDFLRAALVIDPGDDMPLAREIELQSLYLSIEALRFSDRLRVTIDVPEALRKVQLPSLILQPLVENAIKHGVARSDRTTEIEIVAAHEDGGMRLTVRNTVANGAREAAAGHGIGLANVARRLLVRYDHDCGFMSGIDAEGRFAASFVIPAGARDT
jgi:signal transduction histidine kinase